MSISVREVLPASLDEVGDDNVFPVHVLRDANTALVLFSARWHGRQDAYHVAKQGLRGTCVDRDARRLDEMRAIYPDDWEFVDADVFEFADHRAYRGDKWDVVTLDPFTDLFQRCADLIAVWCSLARNAVILGTGVATIVGPPDGWETVERVRRSHKYGGVFWTVMGRS